MITSKPEQKMQEILRRSKQIRHRSEAERKKTRKLLEKLEERDRKQLSRTSSSVDRDGVMLETEQSSLGESEAVILINFGITEKELEALMEYGQEGETRHTTAQRLLLKLLRA